jgi:hypothetical protein
VARTSAVPANTPGWTFTCLLARSFDKKRQVSTFCCKVSIRKILTVPAGLVKWSPRKPNKRHKPCSGAKTRKYDTRTHNQLCSAKYFEAVQSGHSDHKDALATAIANLEAELNAKVNAKSARREDRARAKRETSVAGSNASSNASSSKDVNSPGSSSNDAAESVDGRYRSNSRGGCTVSLVPLKRGLSDDEDEEEGDDEDGGTTPVGSQVIEMSSDEGETSEGSDSE